MTVKRKALFGAGIAAAIGALIVALSPPEKRAARQKSVIKFGIIAAVAVVGLVIVAVGVLLAVGGMTPDNHPTPASVSVSVAPVPSGGCQWSTLCPGQ